MNDIQHHNDFPPLTIERIGDLADAVHQDRGSELSAAEFAKSCRAY
ncbi:hypothetical protein [Burkholderia pseudomallei]|nr:hypothetical protein [Burkholderia pseudomallei]